MTLPALIVPTLLGATKAKPSSDSSEFLLLAIIAVAFYLIAIRPQRQRAKKQQALISQFEVGQEVLTAGGLVGHIIEIDGDRMTLETSVGASFVVLRSYVIRRLDTDPFPAATGVSADVEDDDDEDDSDGHGGGYAIGGAAIGGRARRNGATPRDEVDTDEDADDDDDEDADVDEYEDEDEDDGVETGGIDDGDDEEDGEEADDPGQPGHVNG
jgi:preprotein translocase subunit YajC